MARLSADQRRAQAREVALAKLRAGARYEELTLREIARELGIPLSTLTYAYVSISDLLADFDGMFHASLISRVGAGGLETELTRYLEGMYEILTQDSSLAEINRFRYSKLGTGSQSNLRVAAAELITEIRARAQESYRLADEVISRMFSDAMTGAYMHWLDDGPDQAIVFYQTMRAVIDAITLAADPQPMGHPRRGNRIALPDYTTMLPGSATIN